LNALVELLGGSRNKIQEHDQRGLLHASFWPFGETIPSSWPKENKSLPTLGWFFLKNYLVFLGVARIKANALVSVI